VRDTELGTGIFEDSNQGKASPGSERLAEGEERPSSTEEKVIEAGNCRVWIQSFNQTSAKKAEHSYMSHPVLAYMLDSYSFA
jgi:hypothetical protein